jgi:signal transduction histidine kinase
LTIDDNGHGISEEDIRNPRSIGLVGMRERAMVFQGTVEIERLTGSGTRIHVTVPLR